MKNKYQIKSEKKQESEFSRLWLSASTHIHTHKLFASSLAQRAKLFAFSLVLCASSSLRAWSTTHRSLYSDLHAPPRRSVLSGFPSSLRSSDRRLIQ